MVKIGRALRVCLLAALLIAPLAVRTHAQAAPAARTPAPAAKPAKADEKPGAGPVAEPAAKPAPKGRLEVTYMVEDERETFLETWQETTAEGKPGPYVVALPFPVRLDYRDTGKAADARDPDIVKRVELLADRALLWFKPEEGKEPSSDPLAGLAEGASNIQIYGEGNIWMRYSAGSEYVVIRADRVFLDFARGKFSKFNFTGKLDNVRAHSSAGEGEGASAAPVPLRYGAGVGNAVEEARNDPVEGRVGAAPNDDAIPEKTGKPKSLPQERGSRFFVRAGALRILSFDDTRQEILLEDGSVSSSSLAVASYSLAAQRLRIVLRKERSTIYATRPSVRILDFPLLTVPVEEYKYDIDTIFPLRQLDITHSSRFGFALRSYIDAIAAYDFFADPEPSFHPLALGPQLDYFEKRGVGGGVNLDWGNIRPFRDHGRAGLRSYLIKDRGDDRERARDLGWFPLDKEYRGRFHANLTKNFGDNWQLDGIFGYYSDRNFRREFYEDEFYRNLPTDTFIRMTKRYNEFNYYLNIAPRLSPFESKTEYLPALGFDVSRAAIGDFGLQMSSHAEIAYLRFTHADGDPRRRIGAARADISAWFNLPIDAGIVALDPFLGVRATLARDYLAIPQGAERPELSPDGTFPDLAPGQERRSGMLYRLLPFIGLNAQTFFSAVYPDVRVPILNIDGIRHVIAPYVRYSNVFFNSLDEIPERAFIPFDAVDTLDEFHEVRVGIRNRVQTRQGQGSARRTVDYFEIAAEIPVCPHPARDNDDRVFGLLETSAVWRPAPGFTISGGGFYDFYDGEFSRVWTTFSMDVLDVATGSLYYRRLRNIHEVVGVNVGLTLSDVYGVRLLQEYDLNTGKMRDTRFELNRRVLELFTLGFVFVRDAVDGSLGFYVSITASFEAPRGSSNLLR
ncbi:MAG: LPS assembly protein LptD [Planctomycetes bacterium]|nr:LPS assembly protein LptD [Planctomycetota bacterium]